MLGNPVHVTADCPISSQIISNLLAREKTDEVGMILNFEEQWDGDRTRFTVEPNPAYEGTWCAQDEWELPSDKDEPTASLLAAYRIDGLNTVPIRYTVTVHIYESESEKSLHLYSYDSRVESNCRDYALRMGEHHRVKPVEVSGLGLPLIRDKELAAGEVVTR